MISSIRITIKIKKIQDELSSYLSVETGKVVKSSAEFGISSISWMKKSFEVFFQKCEKKVLLQSVTYFQECHIHTSEYREHDDLTTRTQTASISKKKISPINWKKRIVESPCLGKRRHVTPCCVDVQQRKEQTNGVQHRDERQGTRHDESKIAVENRRGIASSHLKKTSAKIISYHHRNRHTGFGKWSRMPNVV